MDKKKVRLGLDLDGVIYRWGDTARYLLETYWNLSNVPLEGRIENYIPQKANTWLWNEGVKKHGLFRYGSIYKGSREFLNRMEKYCDNIVITARPASAIPDTLDWLSYQKLPTAEIHILGPDQKKSSVKPRCDLYLDDASHVAEDLLQKTKATIILPDRPSNQDAPVNQRVVRTTSWEEIEEIIKAKYKEINGEDSGKRD